MAMDEESFLSGMRARGYEARTLPVSRLPDIEREIGILRQQGLLNDHLYDSYLKGMIYRPPDELPNARSIVIVAAPAAKLRVYFHWRGKEVMTVVPPTYAHALETIEEVKEVLMASTSPSNGRFERAVIPLKTVAARSGLVRYGRNNITYAKGLGSYHRLVGFYTDLEFPVDHWREKEMLPSCKHCRRCLEACPTEVITEDRFLVHIERCLTFLNEMPAEVPFPSSVRKEWHNAIVGCMRCQEACPQNHNVEMRVEDGGHFSEEETGYLLRGDFQGPEDKVMNERLERCGLDLTIFPRNLRALLPD